MELLIDTLMEQMKHVVTKSNEFKDQEEPIVMAVRGLMQGSKAICFIQIPSYKPKVFKNGVNGRKNPVSYVEIGVRLSKRVTVSRSFQIFWITRSPKQGSK